MEGRTCRLEALSVTQHAAGLFAANRLEPTARHWTYLSYGPFGTLEEYSAWVASVASGDDPLFYAVLDRETGQAVGVVSYLRIQPAAGCIEVGHIHYSPRLQRTVAATETMYLMMERAFALGYRRYEWKCDALNAPSRVAAQRLGFSFEGLFRQATVVRGRNRDTAWYAITDTDWPALREAYQPWLDPANFDTGGQQRTRLSELTAPFVHQRG